MDYSPDAVTRRFIAAEERLSALIDTVRPEQWGAPSPCEDWTAHDVVAHVVDTQRDFLARFQIALGEPAPADAAAPAVWRAHVEAVRPVVTDPQIVATPFDGYFGPTTIGDTLVRFYVGDMIVHRWDLARAVGGDDALAEDEMDLLEANFDSYGDAAYADGVFRRPVAVADEADRATLLLAKMGRSA